MIQEGEEVGTVWNSDFLFQKSFEKLSFSSFIEGNGLFFVEER